MYYIKYLLFILHFKYLSLQNEPLYHVCAVSLLTTRYSNQIAKLEQLGELFVILTTFNSPRLFHSEKNGWSVSRILPPGCGVYIYKGGATKGVDYKKRCWLEKKKLQYVIKSAWKVSSVPVCQCANYKDFFSNHGKLKESVMMRVFIFKWLLRKRAAVKWQCQERRLSARTPGRTADTSEADERRPQ